MNYDDSISKIENNIKKINELHETIVKKTNEVAQKIETLNKKKTLKMDDSTPFLVFQNKILHNELTYLNNHKQIINSSLNTMLVSTSENITMMALTLITMYKDIIGSDNKLVKNSKKDENTKIVSDIIHNLELIEHIINDIKNYNTELSENVKTNNLHCKTLEKNINIICGHIELEFQKHKNDIEKTLEYFMDYTNKILEQENNMIILKFVS
jgi:hypothetical protein